MESGEKCSLEKLAEKGKGRGFFGVGQTTKSWAKLLLLMAEILHQFIGSLSRYLQGFIHPRWCKISAINSTIPEAACLGHIAGDSLFHRRVDHYNLPRRVDREYFTTKSFALKVTQILSLWLVNLPHSNVTPPPEIRPY